MNVFFPFSSLLSFNVRVVFLALHLHHTAPGDVKDVQKTVTAGSVRNPHTVIDEGETVPPEKMVVLIRKSGFIYYLGRSHNVSELRLSVCVLEYVKKTYAYTTLHI